MRGTGGVHKAVLALIAMIVALVVVPSVAAAATDTIFGNATPATVDSGDPTSVELGVKFKSEVAGSVTGIRFYKAATNTGTHIGSLWTAEGALLASATFTGESASGWQQVSFSQPVQISANTTYVAGYLAPNGHYSDTSSGFATKGVSNPPLEALANSTSSNGVYTYSAGSTFPTSTFNATNYWVDVMFEPPSAPPGQATGVKATAGTGSASLTWNAPSSGGPVFSYTITPYIGSNPQPSTTINGAPPPTGATVSGLTGGTSYTFTVTASNAVGSGAASEHSNAVTPSAPTAPSAPTGVSATEGNGSATVKWVAPFDGGSTITKYTITPYIGSSPQSATTINGSPPEPSTTVSGLTNGTTYTFTVSATNAVGGGPASEHSNPVTPNKTPISYPDLQVLMPTGEISIMNQGGQRLLEFTHITEDAGAGPLEMRPVYNAQTGISQGYQALYTMPSPGVWKFDHTVPIVGPMIWNPPSDYNFPLDKFWLYKTAGGGGVGGLVEPSPKDLFCMTSDTFVGGVPNAPANNEYPSSGCGSPEGTLGLSVGWGDQYDATDGGEGIPITGLANGTYWLRGEVDPYHYLAESNTANNLTDTKLRIEGSSVTVIEQTHPDSTPPTVNLIEPAANSTISGTVQLTATASGPAPISSVQFLLDGQPIGAPVTAPPYKLSWPVGSTSPGKHFLSAQATDANGFVGTAADTTVTVGGKVGSIGIDTLVSQSATTSTTTPAFSTTNAGDLLLAFVDGDGASPGGQTSSVTGAGLQWTLVKRANTQAGTAEVWSAAAPSALSGATVTASAGEAGFAQSLTVVALSGAAGVGTSASASGTKGAPSVALTSSGAGAAYFATGEDPDRAVGPKPGSGQELLAQAVEQGASTTFWSQYDTSPSSSGGQAITLNDTAPKGDKWNLAGVEVLPGAPDTEPPTAAIINPLPGHTVSGTTTVAASASDNVGVASVQFLLDGKPLGAPVTKEPYGISWNTTEASNGVHTLSAIVKDTSGNTGEAPAVEVTVQNPAEEGPCFVMDVKTSVEGGRKVITKPFTTAEAGEQLFAFVSADGPAGAGQQSATVSGAGVTWKLVARANQQSGDAEIWTATAPKQLGEKKVKSKLAVKGYDQMLTLIAMQMSAGAGVSATAGGTSGEPHVSLNTTEAADLVFGVGSDWSSATSHIPGENQLILRQGLDSLAGKTYWTQYTSHITGPAGELVTLNDTSPTSDQWNMAAVEVLGDGPD